MLKQQIDQDLKTALLAGNKDLVTVIRGLKSVILYAEVAAGARDKGLADEEILALFAKEAKKRQESADLYRKAGDDVRANAEMSEKKVIEKYLPAQLSDTELRAVIESVVVELDVNSTQEMGRVVGMVKQKVGASADGSRIALLVKERLS